MKYNLKPTQASQLHSCHEVLSESVRNGTWKPAGHSASGDHQKEEEEGRYDWGCSSRYVTISHVTSRN